MSDLDLCLPIVVPITILFIIMVSTVRGQQQIDMNSAASNAAGSKFALEKTKASLAVVGCLIVLSAYALFDYFIINHNLLINSNRDLWYAPILSLSAIPAYIFLKTNKVPHIESLSLSMLLAISVLSAYVPAIQRIDQILSDGVHSYEYILHSEASFAPASPGPPPIKVLKPKAYWAQFKEGSIHKFDLIHGPLNVWQLETTKLDNELKLFFDNRKQ